jgi:hypothetical protein
MYDFDVLFYDHDSAAVSNTYCTTSFPPCSVVSDDGTKLPENDDRDTVSDFATKVRRKLELVVLENIFRPIFQHSFFDPRQKGYRVRCPFTEFTVNA